MRTLVDVEIKCIPDGAENEATGKIGPPRYVATRRYDDGTVERGSATEAEIKKYRCFTGMIDAGIIPI